jgi:hypothetical protein
MDRALVVRLLSVAAVAALMLPFGHMAFPFVSNLMSGLQFQAVEAVVSATAGFAISAFIG